MARDLLLHPINVVQSLCQNCLLHVYLKPPVTFKSIVLAFTQEQVMCFWIVSNSQQVLSSSNKVNYFSTAKHDSFDFLY